MNLALPLLVAALIVPGQPPAPAASNNPQVVFHTSKGEIVIELYPDKAPKTVENFLAYTRDGFFSGTIFHRVIPGFVVQGGGFTADMEQKPTKAPIANEAGNGLRNYRGTLSMARTMDPHSATSQFFINLVDNPGLDHPGRTGWGYAVFGKVVSGMEVVDAMAKVQTGNRGPHADVPLEPITVTKAEIKK